MSEPHKNNKETNEPNLKGTLISVSLLGAFLLVSWFGVWSIFVSR